MDLLFVPIQQASASVWFFALVGVTVTGLVTRFVVDFVDKRSLKKKTSHQWELEEGAPITNEAKQSLQRAWYHASLVPELRWISEDNGPGTIKGEPGGLQMAATMRPIPGEGIYRIVVAMRCPSLLSFHPVDEQMMRRMLGVVFLSGNPPNFSQANDEFRPFILPKHVTESWDPLSERPLFQGARASQTDLILNWNLPPSDKQMIPKLLQLSIEAGTTQFAQSRAQLGGVLQEVLSAPKDQWTHCYTLWMLLLGWSQDSRFQPLCAQWLGKWKQVFSLTDQAHSEVVQSLATWIEEAKPLPRSLWFPFAMTYIQDQIDRDQLSEESWPAELFCVAHFEQALPRELFLERFEALAAQMTPAQASEHLQSAVFDGPQGPKRHKPTIYQPLRDFLWQRLKDAEDDQVLIEALITHSRVGSDFTSQEIYQKVSQDLSHGTWRKWGEVMLARLGPATWFIHLAHLAQHQPQHLEAFQVGMLARPHMADDLLLRLLYSMEVNGGRASLNAISVFLDQAERAASIKQVAKDIAQTIRERLGTDAIGAISLIDDQGEEGQLSFADQDAGKLSLGEPHGELPPETVD